MNMMLLKGCVSQLREMQASSEMTLADRKRLNTVIEDLESLQAALAAESDVNRRRDLVAQYVERAASMILKILIDLD
jgi:hypothetical protein